MQPKPPEALLIATRELLACGWVAECCRQAIPQLLRHGYDVTIEFPREPDE